jgi:hypothetical protein
MYWSGQQNTRRNISAEISLAKYIDYLLTTLSMHILDFQIVQMSNSLTVDADFLNDQKKG